MGLLPLLALLALLVTVVSATGKVPLWIPLLLVSLTLLMSVWQ